MRTRQARNRTAERNKYVQHLKEAQAAGGRPHGVCRLCERGHAYPDVWWRCECGEVLCWWDVSHGGCECGGEVEVEVEVME